MNEQEFPQGSVPVAVAARVYGKDASWVRAGIVSGWLPIGKATRSGKLVTTIEEMDQLLHLPKASLRGDRIFVERRTTIMATEIRPELSEKNPYWIGKHRYYELKHFCLQYPIWKKAYNALLGLSSRPNDLDIFVKSGQVHSDPTARCAESRVSFAKRMELVEQAAIGTDGDLYPYILRGVTEGLSYNALKMQYAIPCCREVYYNLYRRFFWLLSKERD